MKNHETRLRTPAAVTGLSSSVDYAAGRHSLCLLISL